MNDADKKLLELAEKANAQGLLPMTVFRCEFDRETEPDVACGFNGCILDASNDECHHVLSLAEANYIVAAANAVPRLIDEKEALQTELDEQILQTADVLAELDKRIKVNTKLVAEKETLLKRIEDFRVGTHRILSPSAYSSHSQIVDEKHKIAREMLAADDAAAKEPADD